MDGQGVIADAAVVVEGSEIRWVGPARELGSAGEPAMSRGSADDLVVERFDGHVLMPGFLNGHSHLAMTMFRGVADDRNLEDFLATVLPLEAALLSPDRVHDATRAALVESHLAGVTSVLDMYFFADAAREAALECGARLFTGPVMLDGDTPDGEGGSWAHRLDWSRRWLAARPASDGWTPVVGPHSVYTVSPDHLLEAAEVAAEAGALLHIHAAESETEIAMVQSQHGRRPVELLDDLGLLRPGTVLAHAVHLVDAEIDRLAETGTAVVHCPASNLKLASGVAPVRTMLQRGVTVALGTDGAASSNDLDLFGAIRLSALIHKTVAPEGADASSHTAAEVLGMATAGGAAALGQSGRLGVLRAGALADIISLDLSGPHLQPVVDPVSTVVYAAGRGDVCNVWSNGERVVRDGRHAKVDETGVVADLVRMGRIVGEHASRHASAVPVAGGVDP